MVFHFLNCELDSERCELRRAGEPVALRAKVFQLLVYLVEQRHRRVSKDELLEQVWPGRVIAEATLNSCIKALRQAVGDDGQRQQVIQTVRGLGYRFVAEVRQPPPPTPPSEVPLSLNSAPDPAPADAPSRPLPLPDPDTFPLGKEYKQVSVLCGAVTEARALAQRLDPEAMDQLMHDFFALAGQAIERYEGAITQRHGDGFIALFGAPRAHEDHARRAVLAALKLLASLAAHAPLAAGLGIHTGPVVVSGLADTPQQPYTALGVTTDSASQLQQRAAPGTLLISEAVYRLVSTEVRVEPHGPLADDGVAAYAVRGIRRRLAGVPQRKAVSRFVGRERELAILHQYLAQVASGRGQVVGILGEPGIGKSRLLQEFRRKLGDDATRYLEGRCLSYGKTSPYLPLLDLLRQCCGVGVDDSGEVTATKLARTLDELAIAPDARPLLLQLLNINDTPAAPVTADPQQRRARTFAYLRQLIQQQARRRLCVLAVEDAHWIDATSDDWLAELVARLAGIPLLLLITYRPGYRPAWLERSEATQLALAPLPRGDSERLLRSLPPGGRASAQQIGRIAAKAQGNPFFLEELSWAANQTDPAFLPDTVQAVVAARIDRLDAQDKQLLQTAAVIGASVPAALLQGLMPFSEEALAQGLQRLQAAEFLFETQTFPAAIYTFKHALTREVAYQTLLRGTRQRLHREIAERLRRAPTEPPAPPELIAYHYTEAGLAEPAIDYWQLAAHQAGQRSAAVEAIGHLQQALHLLQAVPASDVDAAMRAERELRLQLELGVLQQVVKGAGSAEVERTYANALRLSDRAGNASQRFAALWGSWRLHNARGDYDIAYRIANDLLELAERENQPYLLLEARHALWTITGSLGRLDIAQEHITAGLELSGSALRSPLAPAGGHDPLVCALGTAAIVAWLRGHAEQAQDYAGRTLRLAGELDHPPTLAQGLVDMVDYYQLRQEAAPLRAQAEQLIACATEHSFAMPRARGLFSLGWCLARQGRCDEGIIEMRQALADLKQTGYMRSSPYLQALFAERCAAAGRPEEALANLNGVLAGIDRIGSEFWLLAETYRLVGEILLSQTAAKQNQAERYFQSAIALARRQNAKAFELRAAASLCRCWRERGKRGQAYQILAAIYGEFTEGFDTADLLTTKALLDKLTTAAATNSIYNKS